MTNTNPIVFLHHPKFLEELEKFIKDHCHEPASLDETIETIQNLLRKHFYENNIQFTHKHLGLAQGFGGYGVYWFHLIIPNSGLSRTQFPKSYFLKTSNVISFLCLDSHITNYKEAELRKLAQKRLEEILVVVNK